MDATAAASRGWRLIGQVDVVGFIAQVGVGAQGDITLRQTVDGPGSMLARTDGSLPRREARKLRDLLNEALGEEQVGPTVIR